MEKGEFTHTPTRVWLQPSRRPDPGRSARWVDQRFAAQIRRARCLTNLARILWLGAGTKTGKSVGVLIWLAEGILAGEPCAMVAPWFPRVRAHFETLRSILAPLIGSKEIRVSENLLRIRAANGGGLDCFSGDNFQGIFGGNFKRVLVDEASRCPPGVWPAVLTTISGANGKARVVFNLDLGGRNWAIKNLLRVQAMTEQEQRASGEDYMIFPTLDGGLVAAEVIELMRSQMPLALWESLYEGKIPSDDTSLFRNLDEIFTGQERGEPEPGHSYVAGIDLARKADFSVVSIIDCDSGAVVAGDRFSELSWNVQYGRCSTLYKKFRCSKAFVDATGIGDVAIEELRKLGMDCEGIIFTQQSRKDLLEGLIVACDQKQIALPATFAVWRAELEAFECILDGSSIRYAAPSGMHDDTAMSLALAVYGFKSTVHVYGLVEYFRSGAALRDLLRLEFPRITLGLPTPTSQPVLQPVTQRPALPAPQENPQACPRCGGSQFVIKAGTSGGLWCNQCRLAFGPNKVKVIYAGFQDGRPGFVEREV